MLLQLFMSTATLATTIIAAPSNPQTKPKPAAFFLAGDSTTAIQAPNGGGWGTGFLTTTLRASSTGTNFGHNGATTSSFRTGGNWSAVLSAASSSLQNYTPYITIQFGHNDQKPDKNISMDIFTSNLVAFVQEARAVNATPILVTSLSRRRFSNSTGKINQNLADVTLATKEAARITGANLIDLNAASTAYLNAIGPELAATYNLNPTDFTHLNTQGSVLFGNMVAQLLEEEVPGLKKYVQPMKEVVKAIRKGKYWFPEQCEGDFCG